MGGGGEGGCWGGWTRAVGVVQAHSRDFLREGAIQRVDGPNDAREASLWGREWGAGGGGMRGD